MARLRRQNKREPNMRHGPNHPQLGTTTDSAPGDACELKWEFDEERGRYYVSFPDDQ